MQSAFVNIGLERDGFLYVSDVLPDIDSYTAWLDDNEDDSDEPSPQKRQSRRSRDNADHLAAPHFFGLESKLDDIFPSAVDPDDLVQLNSEMLNAGMSLQNLQSLLGHNCIEMTRRYARLTDNTRREQYYKAMEKIERGDINGHYRFDPELP